MLEMMLGSTPKSEIRIKKAMISTYAAMALTETGGLYCRGSVGFLRGVGKTETFTDKWYLIDDHVVDYVNSNALSGVIYRRDDGEWWGAGNVSGLGANTLNCSIKTNLSANFAALPTDATIVSHVSGSNTSMILMSNGDVYNAGYATNGALGIRESTGDIRTFGKLLTGAGTGFPEGVKFKSIAVGINNNTAYFVTTDNYIYALGAGTNYAMGSNNNNSANRVAVGLGNGAYTNIYAGANCYYYELQNRMLSGIGNYIYGQIGGGKYPVNYSTGTGLPTSIVTGAGGTTIRVFVLQHRVYVENAGQWWFVGGQSGYGLGSTTAITRGTPANITAGMGGDFTGADIYSCDPSFFNTVAVKDGTLYGTGYNYGYANALAPLSKDSGNNVFIPLDITGIEI